MAISLTRKKGNNPIKEQPAYCRLLLFIALTIFVQGCKSEGDKSLPHAYKKVIGQTMGTTYSIVYKPNKKEVKKETIDSILVSINQSVSTYIDTSTISKINQSATYGQPTEILVSGRTATQSKIELNTDLHFEHNYKIAKRIYLDTDGYFDPTVMPLVNYWGFGYTPKKLVTQVDSQKVKTILEYVGMEKLTAESTESKLICIKPVQTELDFSAIAKGYAVDYIAHYLTEQGVDDLMVEIGGETFAKGISPRAQNWVIGLNTPKVESTLNDFSSYLNLNNTAVASSGNYRIYYEVDGKKYGHEINPKTGYPERNALLGVSVIAPTCMEADAVATALMVMGQEKATTYIAAKPHLEALLFVGNDEGGITMIRSTGFEAYEADLSTLVESK